MVRVAIAACLALSAGDLSGCALAGGEPPSVDVTGVNLVAIGLTEQQLAVTLCVTNPNRDELAFRRVTATIDVAGAPLATGETALPVRVPPLASAAVPFTVVTTVRNIGPQLLGILRSGGVDYRVHGTVTLDGGWAFTLPFSRSGRLDPLGSGLALADAATRPAPSGCGPVAAGAT